MTPEKAVSKQKYTKAMDLALEANKHYLKVAADSLSQQTLRAYTIENPNSIKAYKKNQNKFNHVLTKIGESNIKTKGLVSESYNSLCDVKYELDLKIVDYYYQEGKYLLEKSKTTNEKRWAREAYYEFTKSEKEGASTFYNDVEKLRKESLALGSILISAPYNLDINNKFGSMLNTMGN